MNISFYKKTKVLDLIGMTCSVACTLHCLLVPVLAAFAPSVGVFFENEWIHIALVVSLVPVALLAFLRGKSRHGGVWPLWIGLFGIVLLLSALGTEVLEQGHLEKPLTVLGSTMLVVAHALNFRKTR